MDPSSSSASVIHSSSFTQQGTIDWGQLTSKFVSYTIEVLSRLSAANIQPLTIEVGSLACHQFHISSAGRANVRKAIQTLGSYSAFGNAVWFGFGIRHMVYTLANTDGGFTCLAMCAALSEYYPEDISAEILNELAKSLGAPSRLTPSILQWSALLKSCAGIFARTELGVLIGKLQEPVEALYPHENPFEPSDRYYGYAAPNSTAEALRGIGSVSRGDIATITIVGGRDIFWLAAICKWLFSLSVEIRTTEDIPMHSGSIDPEPQVIFVFKHQSGSDTPTSPQVLSLQSVRKTYILRDAGFLLKNKFPNRVFSGRASWEHIFTSVFSEDFEKLIYGQEQTLGVAIGSAARILLGIVSAEEELPKDLIDCWPTYHSASFGRGFVDHLVSQFPELRMLKRIMHDAAKTSFQDAKVAYENQIQTLIQQCNCRRCAPDLNPKDYERFCRVVMFETILSLGYNLSEVDVAPNMFLKTATVRVKYQRQAMFRLALVKRTREKREANDESGWYLTLGPFSLVIGDVFDKGTSHRMSRCLELFSGLSVNLDDEIAASEGGICCYRRILSGGPSDDPDECHIIQIVPGSIEHNEKPFSRISDDRSERYRIPKSSLRSVTSYTQIKIYLTETVETLKIYFQLTAPKDPAVEPLKITSLELMEAISHARGWVKCATVDCKMVCDVQEGGNMTITFLGNEVQMIEGNALARCAALILARIQGSVCLLRNSECLQCCIKTGAGGNLMKHYYWPNPYPYDYTAPRSTTLVIVSPSHLKGVS